MPNGKAERLILAPINGTDCDGRAIEVAIMLGKRNHAEVIAIHIVEVPQELPLESEMARECAVGEDVLHAAEQFAAQYGRDIEIELLQARTAGPAIVDEAVGRGATQIVMSTTIRRRSGETTVGRTTVPYVMKNAPCEVIVVRRPIDEEPCAPWNGGAASR